MTLHPRLIQDQLQKLFFKGKALVITGARQVGKTTLAQQLVQGRGDVIWLNADEQEVRERLAEQRLSSLRGVVGAYKVVVIDEVQRIHNAGLLLKLLVDNFKDVQVIATGSSALEISESIFEPLTGRQFHFHLYPFAMLELYKDKSPFELEQRFPFHMVYGNYPGVVNAPELAELQLRNLKEEYLYKDVLVWKDIRKPQLLESLLQLLAWQVCGEVSMNELANTLKVKSETVESYIDLLEKAFVVFRLRAYSTNPRKEVSKMTKLYFWDNGIRNAIIGDFDPLSARNDVGALWENFTVSERAKLNAALHPGRSSYFWRNYNQSEVDYLEKSGKEPEAYEFKWNTRKQHRISRAFSASYPEAQSEVINPRNCAGFLGFVE